MTITTNILRNAAARFSTTKSQSLTEAHALGMRTVFLCHSHLDKELVNGVVTLLKESGWRVYVDWADTSMPETPNRETASRIKQKIVDLDFFIFLATTNSTKSRWCPWEIGYADGRKPIDRILVLPTSDTTGTYGNEYLQLYRRIDMYQQNILAVWQPGDNKNGILINRL
jgi:hypothetical protein